MPPDSPPVVGNRQLHKRLAYRDIDSATSNKKSALEYNILTELKPYYRSSGAHERPKGPKELLSTHTQATLSAV